MKNIVIAFVAIVSIVLFVVLINNDSHVDVFAAEKETNKQVSQDTVNTEIVLTKIEDTYTISEESLNDPIELTITLVDKTSPKVDKSIPSKVAVYLKDEVVELKIGTGLKEVDQSWGEPRSVERKYKDGYTEIIWRYGDYWSRKSKLKGKYYYKFAIFKDGKLDWYRKDADVKVKTHNRNSAVLDYLDEGPVPTKGMSKKDIYKIWGLPYGIALTCFNNKTVKERWMFRIDGKLSHYCELENNKLVAWDDY